MLEYLSPEVNAKITGIPVIHLMLHALYGDGTRGSYHVENECLYQDNQLVYQQYPVIDLLGITPHPYDGTWILYFTVRSPKGYIVCGQTGPKPCFSPSITLRVNGRPVDFKCEHRRFVVFTENCTVHRFILEGQRYEMTRGSFPGAVRLGSDIEQLTIYDMQDRERPLVSDSKRIIDSVVIGSEQETCWNSYTPMTD